MSLACRLVFLILWKALVAFTAAGILFVKALEQLSASAELSALLYHAICNLR